MKYSATDILTPANALTLLGFILTVVGATSLNTISGFTLVIAGRLIDIADGQVARRTHTSRFGTAMDTVADKIGSLVILFSAFYFNLVPLAFLLFVFWQHIAVSIIAIYAALGKRVLRVMAIGRQNMFLHALTIFLLIATNFSKGSLHVFFYSVGVVLIGASIAFGISTTIGYARQASADYPRNN